MEWTLTSLIQRLIDKKNLQRCSVAPHDVVLGFVFYRRPVTTHLPDSPVEMKILTGSRNSYLQKLWLAVEIRLQKTETTESVWTVPGARDEQSEVLVPVIGVNFERLTGTTQLIVFE